jgi:hypothetical protein
MSTEDTKSTSKITILKCIVSKPKKGYKMESYEKYK